MTDPDSSEEWLARRAAWREDWPYVQAYVTSSSLTSKMQAILDEGHAVPHRCIILVGVYTCYGIEFEDVEYLKATWNEAVMFMRHSIPGMIEQALDYWQKSVLRYYEVVGPPVDPKDFGFSE